MFIERLIRRKGLPYPLADNSWAGKRTLGDMDSFEELEGHQIQTIPEALLEEGSHEGLQSREPEVRTRFEIPSQASTPASWPVSEITGDLSIRQITPHFSPASTDCRSHALRQWSAQSAQFSLISWCLSTINNLFKRGITKWNR